MAKVNRFFPILGLSGGFLEDLYDNKSKYVVKRLEVLLKLMLVLFAATVSLVLLQEVGGDLTTIRLSHDHYVHWRQILLKSVIFPKISNLLTT